MGDSSKSPGILHYTATSCEGCDSEMIEALTPHFHVERFRSIDTCDTKKASILLVTGSLSRDSSREIRAIYAQMPDPKVVLGIGACSLSGGVLDGRDSGGLNSVIPVDVYVPGCCAQSEDILDAVSKALSILEKKAANLQRGN